MSAVSVHSVSVCVRVSVSDAQGLSRYFCLRATCARGHHLMLLLALLPPLSALARPVHAEAEAPVRVLGPIGCLLLLRPATSTSALLVRESSTDLAAAYKVKLEERRAWLLLYLLIVDLVIIVVLLRFGRG